MVALKKIIIKNFKSLRDCEIDVGKLNVVVGANASGKSNLVEIFKLLKKIYVDRDINPFFEWWGYDNVVWQRREELPITIGLFLEIDEYKVYFETTFSGIGGSFQISRETLDIKGYLKFEKVGDEVTIRHNPEFIENIFQNLRKFDATYGLKKKLRNKKTRLLKEIKIKLESDQALFDFRKRLFYGGELVEKTTGLTIIVIPVSHLTDKDFPFDIKDKNYILIPAKTKTYVNSWSTTIPIYWHIIDEILSIIANMQILFPLNIRSMKVPQPLRKDEKLREDGSNIASVFHSIYLKEGKLPDEIRVPLSIIFPNMDLRPQLTEDGRVMIKVFEDGLELLPPNVSDGFYKVLSILAVLYLRPPLLVIDEIENSLHPETLELIIDTIRESRVQTIITTHSPVVVDMVEPSDLILVEKVQGETKFRRIKDPNKVKEFLREKGITFSEGWLYGELFKTDDQA